MKRIIMFLWEGCWHKWATTGSGNYKQTSDWGDNREGYYYAQQCERCGRHRLDKAL